MNCIVKGCENRSDQGSGLSFEGETGNKIWFCYPCWSMIVAPDKGGQHSQVYRNVEAIGEEIIAEKGISRKAQAAVKLIFAELTSAEKKFPWWPSSHIRAAAIVAEESGELTKEANNFEYNFIEKAPSVDKMRKEAKQTGAMAIRFLVGLAGGYAKTKPE